jgi:wyosine [tRNA(Phe)-imidazoG37] synthetase (radical SAM superfamily)
MSKLFQHHPRTWKDNRFVYPVISRRSKGLSIGINLNPDAACNFDCIYCSVDRSTPSAVTEVDLELLQRELNDMLELSLSGRLFEQEPFNATPAGLRRVNDVAFSGDGEPTSYARFGDACELVIDCIMRAEASDVKIVVITNATLLHRPCVREALDRLDQHNGEIWAKLDAGTETYYRQVERTKVPFQRVLDNLLEAGRVRPIVIQSMFMRINDQPPAEAEIDAYLARLRDLTSQGCRIKLVQVYTVARATAESFVTPLERDRIDAIAARVRDLGLPAESYAGPA